MQIVPHSTGPFRQFGCTVKFLNLCMCYQLLFTESNIKSIKIIVINGNTNEYCYQDLDDTYKML